MSLSLDARQLLCDGDDCDAAAPYPVTPDQGRAARGWLFIRTSSHDLHFCPRCLGLGKHQPHLDQ